jgi:hypothetical protein
MEKKLPESLLKAVKILVHMKVNIEDSENYRGINLMNSGYKIYNTIKHTLYT